MPSNDNETTQGMSSSAPDAHGRAALLLVESLIHGLCERALLTARQAVEIADRAVNVQCDLAEEADTTGATLRHSHALLSAIAMSLRAEIAYDGTSPALAT